MLDAELGLANELIDRAASIAMPLFRSRPEVRMKDDETPVTQADIRIEEMVRELVANRFPSDAVLGEEGGGSLRDASRVWVVDPIDGTKNFAAGIHVWGTLLALFEEGAPVLGVVGAPALNERYEAVRGQGATLNGSLISVSEVDSLERAALCHYATEAWLDGPHEAALRDLDRAAYRSVGFTDFWGHCLVARGSVEVALEPQLRIWDWGALKVLVEEAGGRMTTFQGEPVSDRTSVISTNGRLHETVLEILATG
ncbi:MAG TPA: inositol monophosphatase family protein [Actinomycetota bacterium]